MDLPSNFKVIIQHGDFATLFGQTLDSLDRSGKQIAPTFAFLDPFGLSQIPFSLISRLLANPSTEILIYFPVNRVRQFVNGKTPAIQNMMSNLFGMGNVPLLDKNDGKLIDRVRLLYQSQLETCATFVRYFQMKDQRNQPIYDLFFASNNYLGHYKMKEAFWKVDKGGGFKFSDETDPHQLVLLTGDDAFELDLLLLSQFSLKRLKVSTILRYVRDKTIFLDKHGKGALKRLETSKRIRVEELKSDGKSRRGKTFPDEVIVIFLS